MVGRAGVLLVVAVDVVVVDWGVYFYVGFFLTLEFFLKMGLGNVVVGSGNGRMCCQCYNTMQMVPLFSDGCLHHGISLDIGGYPVYSVLSPVLFLGPRQQRGGRPFPLSAPVIRANATSHPRRWKCMVGGGGERTGCFGGGRNRWRSEPASVA